MNFNELKIVIKTVDILLSEEEKEREVFVDLTNLSADYLSNKYFPALDGMTSSDDAIYLIAKEASSKD